MNILKGSVVDRSETSARCRLDCGLAFDVAAEPGTLSKGEAISVGIRPENTRIADGKGTGPELIGTIDLVEHLGEVQILYIDLPGCSEKVLIKVDGESAFARTQTIRFTARQEDFHIFDANGSAIRSHRKAGVAKNPENAA